MANTRTHRRYDHRFRNLVRETGKIRLAIENGVPRSTVRGWSQSRPADVVSLDVLSMSESALQKEVLALREQNARLTAILRLVVVLLKVTGVSLARRRVADGVVDQVGKRLLQPPLVAGHGRYRGEVEAQLGAGVA